MVAIGDKVQLKGQAATVRYLGKTEFASGEWVGLELDTPTGKNNGTVQGVEYFICNQPGNFGVFVRPTLLEPRSPVPQDVVAVVNRLQQKLRDALNENTSLRESVEAITKKLKVARSELSTTILSLESATVETEYLRDQNALLLERISKLQDTYEDLSTDHEILKEELDIYKELEDAVSLQLPSESDLTIEDFTVLMQFNKRLELANTSLKKLMNTKENNFNSEIDCLKNELANATSSLASYGSTAKKLDAAENSIRLLQEQLESTIELVSIVERVSNENEALHAKIGQLTIQIEELTELNEIDKALEAEHLKRENELRNSIAALNEALKKETTTVESLLSSNKQLKENLYKVTNSAQESTNDKNSLSLECELAELKALQEYTLKENETKSSDLKFLESFLSQLVPSELSKVTRLIHSISVMQRKVHSDLCPEGVPEQSWRRLQDILSHVITGLEYHYQNINVDALAAQYETFLGVYGSEVNALALLSAISSLEYVVLEETLPLMELPWALTKLATSSALIQIRMEKLIECSPSVNNERLAQIIKKSQEIYLAIEAVRAQHKLSFFSESMIDFQFKDDSIDVENSNVLDNLVSQLDLILDTLRSSPIVPMNMVSIYSNLKEGRSKKDIETLENAQEDLKEKQRRIQDLQLHVGLLERNMTLSLAEKNSEINGTQALLVESQAKIIELKKQIGDIREENAELTRQMDAFLDFNENSKYQQIKFYNDKTTGLEMTNTEALIDEIQLLKRMLKPQLKESSWNMHMEWLHKPLYKTLSFNDPRCSKGLAFLEEAHCQRRATRDLIKAIPKPAPNSQRLRYLRSGV